MGCKCSKHGFRSGGWIMVGAFPGSPSLAGVLCAVVEAALVLPWHPGGVAVQISMVFGFWPDGSPGELGR